MDHLHPGDPAGARAEHRVPRDRPGVEFLAGANRLGARVGELGQVPGDAATIHRWWDPGYAQSGIGEHNGPDSAHSGAAPPHHKPAHCPCVRPETVLACPSLAGAGSLPVHSNGPRTVFAATSGADVVALSRISTMPWMSLPVRASVPVLPWTVIPPRTSESLISTVSAPSAVNRPRVSERAMLSPAPAATLIGPRTVASSRQVTPSVTVSGPVCAPVIVSVHVPEASPYR